MYVTSDIYETDRYETENPRKQKFPFRAVYMSSFICIFGSYDVINEVRTL